MAEEVALKEYLKILIRRRWVIIICLVLAMGVGLSVSLLTPPTYSASAKIFLDNSVLELYPTSDVLNVVIKNDNYLSFVKRELHLNYPVEKLRENINAEQIGRVVILTVYSSKPSEAAEIANLLAKKFVTEAKRDVNLALKTERVRFLKTTLNQLDKRQKEIEEALNRLENQEAETPTEKIVNSLNLYAMKQQLIQLHRDDLSYRKELYDIQVLLTQSGTTKVMSLAATPSLPVKPKLNFNLVLSVVAGLVIGLSLVTVIELLKENKT